MVSNLINQMHFITSIKNLSLNNFIECCVNERYALIITSEHNQEGIILSPSQQTLLAKAWVNLLSQYYEVSGDKAMTDYIQKVGRLNYLKLRQIQISACVSAIRKIYGSIKEINEVLCNELRNFYKNFNPTPETLESELIRVERTENNYKLEIINIESGLATKQKEVGKKASETDFYSVLFDYEEITKVGISDKENMTTFMYAQYRRRLKDKVDQLNRN